MFGITNFLFSKVLVLLVRFTLVILDSIKAKDAKIAFAALSLYVVRKEAIRSSMAVDEVFLGGRHLGRPHPPPWSSE